MKFPYLLLMLLPISFSAGQVQAQPDTPLLKPAAISSPGVIKSIADVPRISPQELKPLLDANHVLVFDVRGAYSYDAKHIKGAMSLPHAAWKLTPEVLKSEKLVVLYCTCHEEYTAAMTALEAYQAGVNPNIKVLLGGLLAWEQKGFPVESSAL